MIVRPQLAFRLLQALAALLGCLFAFAWGNPWVQAQSKPIKFALNWVRDAGAESCISSQGLSQKLTDIVGNLLVSSVDADHALEGIVRRTSAPVAWQVDIRVSDAHGQVLGERKLVSSAAACSALEPSLLLVLALTIDPEAALPRELLTQLGTDAEPGPSLLAELQAAPPAPTTALEVEAGGSARQPSMNEPLASETERPARQGVEAPSSATDTLSSTVFSVATPSSSKRALGRASEEASRWQSEMTVAGALAVGMQPKLSPGVSLDVRLGKPGSFWIASTSIFWFASKAHTQEATERGDEVVFRAWQTTLAACIPLVTRGALELGVCGGGSVGVRWVQARALEKHNDPTRPLGGPSASAEMHYRWSPHWFSSATIAGARFWPHDRFGYQDNQGRDQVLFQPAAVAAWGSLGLGHRF